MQHANPLTTPSILTDGRTAIGRNRSCFAGIRGVYTLALSIEAVERLVQSGANRVRTLDRQKSSASSISASCDPTRAPEPTVAVTDMAGLTTASLVALEEPLDEPALTLHRPRLARWLGLSESTTSLNAVGLLSSALSTITSLVFLNASQPFLLDYLDVKKGRGSVTGTLLLADELVALIVYFIAGAAADRLGIKSVAVAGHVLVAVALVLYVSVKSVFPALLLSRMLFAVCSK